MRAPTHLALGFSLYTHETGAVNLSSFRVQEGYGGQKVQEAECVTFRKLLDLSGPQLPDL